MPSMIINGEITNHLDAFDRGLQYGDGLFETIALKNNALLLWNEHLNRLAYGCQILGLPVIDERQWLDDIRTLCHENKKLKDGSAVIKLILTRGAGGRGYRFPDVANVNCIVSMHPWPEYSDLNYSKGIKAVFCNTCTSTNSTLAGLKHLNKLENVMARNEWHEETVAEGLMFSDEGYVIEGTMSNVFSINDDMLYTPKLNKAGVNGVIRQSVIKLAQALDIDVHEINLTRDVLLNMDEIFVTNSLIGIWPVTELDNKIFKIGEVTNLLMDKLDMTLGACSV